MSKKKRKIVCYCRVSTGSKEQFNSFENQKEFFENYISEHPEYELYKSKECPTGIYADRGVSGTLLHREEFDAMLIAAGLTIQKQTFEEVPVIGADGKETSITVRDYTFGFSKTIPPFTLILVKSTSRFSRNIKSQDVLQKLALKGVYVKFLDLGLSTEKPADLTMIQQYQVFDENFSRDLSRKLLSANEQSRRNQILRSNNGLYGYKYHKRQSRAENNKLTIIDKEAYVIQMIFRLYWGCFYVDPTDDKANPPKMPPCDFDCSNCSINKRITEKDGLGFRNIRMVLNYVYKFRTRKGEEFAQSTLKHIFENEKYAGYLNSGKWDHGPLFNKYSSPKIKENYEAELVHRPDLIPPIVSKMLFDNCTAKRADKANVWGNYYRGSPTEYKGLLYCGACGSTMTHNIGNNGNGLHNCRIKKTKGKQYCDNGNIYDWQFKEILKELCDGGLSEIIERKTILFIETAIALIQKRLDFIVRNRDPQEVDELHNKIEKYTHALSKLYTQRALAETDDIAIQASIDELETELPKLKEEYEKKTKKPATLLKECAELKQMCYTGLRALEQRKTTYTEEELWAVVERFLVYSEVKNIKGGLHGAPSVSAVPVLKPEYLLHTKFNVDLDIEAPVILSDFGLEENNFTEQVKNRLDELEATLKPFETLYL